MTGRSDCGGWMLRRGTYVPLVAAHVQSVLCLRLRNSRVLIVGVGGLGAEVSKNIVLAGVQEVVLLDHTSLESADSACRFLMQKDGANVMFPHMPVLPWLLSLLSCSVLSKQYCGYDP